MSVFRQITPNSVWNTKNARYEYNLHWLSPSGGIRNWFFSSTKGSEEDSFDNFIIEGLSDIRSVPTEERRMIEARTDSMDSDTFDYVKSIMSSNRVYIVGTDFSKTPIAIGKAVVEQPNELKEFSLRIRFEFQQEDALNV